MDHNLSNKLSMCYFDKEKKYNNNKCHGCQPQEEGIFFFFRSDLK